MSEIVQWAFCTIVLTGIGAISWMLKDMKQSIEVKIVENREKNEQIDKKLEALEKDLNEYKERAAYKFVSKDEFVRAVTNMDKKLDKIYDKLTIDK